MINNQQGNNTNSMEQQTGRQEAYRQTESGSLQTDRQTGSSRQRDRQQTGRQKQAAADRRQINRQKQADGVTWSRCLVTVRSGATEYRAPCCLSTSAGRTSSPIVPETTLGGCHSHNTCCHGNSADR